MIEDIQMEQLNATQHFDDQQNQLIEDVQNVTQHLDVQQNQINIIEDFLIIQLEQLDATQRLDDQIFN